MKIGKEMEANKSYRIRILQGLIAAARWGLPESIMFPVNKGKGNTLGDFETLMQGTNLIV